MKNSILILAAVFFLAPALPAAAQTITSHPAVERGKHSLEVSLHDRPQIGYWTRRSDHTDLGFEVGANGYFVRQTTQLGLTFTPALKRYHSSAGPLAPYTFVGLPLSYTRTSHDNTGAPDTNHSTYGVGGIVGLGLDWFPFAAVSIGGHAGVRTSFVDASESDHAFTVNTFTSGIRLHLYF